MGENKPPIASRIILPNDPMSGEIRITYNLRQSEISIDTTGSDIRSAALATLGAAQGLVNQAFEAAGLIVPVQGGPDGNKKKDDSGS